MALHGTKALEKWCKVVTEGYDGVNIVNMSTAWRSGVGFCAIIHHFRPDLIDLAALDPDDALGNNTLAFQTAEQHLGVPALLDPQDMVECELIDRLSVLTYLSQFYQVFRGSTEKAKSGKTPQRTGSSHSSSENSSPSKPKPGATAARRTKEPCKVCAKPVFILERLNVGGKLLHRTCFRCARCSAQLNVVSYYETEGGDYCCDVCPDEEVSMAATVKANQEMVKKHLDSEDSSPSSSEAEDDASRGQTPVSKTDDEKNSNVVESATVADAADPVNVNSVDANDNDASDKCLPVEAEPVKSLDNAKCHAGQDTECSQESRLGGATPDQAYQAVDIEGAEEEEERQPPASDSAKSEPEHVVSAVNLDDEVVLREDNPSEEADHDDNTTSAVTDCVNNLNLNIDGEKADEVPEEAKSDVNEDFVVVNINKEDDDDVKEDSETGQSCKVQDVKQEEVGKDVSAEAETNTLAAVPSDKNTSDENEFESADDGEENKAHEAVQGSGEVKKEEPVYPMDKNPFGDEDEEEDALPDQKKVLQDEINSKKKKESTNPFGSDFEDSEEEEEEDSVKHPSSSTSVAGALLTGPPKPPRANVSSPQPPVTVVGKSLNPFGSDFEDEAEDDCGRPASPSPSSCSSVRSRKKRQAPLPPGKSPVPSPRASARNGAVQHLSAGPVPAPRRTTMSPKPSPRSSRLSPMPGKSPTPTRKAPPPPRPPPPSDLAKERKERDNLNRRSQLLGASAIATVEQQQQPDIVLTPLSPDKAAVDGQWKRKKGPAPRRPIPQKRQVKKLPRTAVNTELMDIEVKQGELERQGVKLETTIRELCEKRDREQQEKGENIPEDRDSLGPEVEDLIIQLFDLVNEKNDLFRRQTELMYMKKDHRLEEEYADIEHKVRVLMAKPDSQRTDDDKLKEEQLITRMMEVVQERNEIVDCLEMDRLRELEEDESFETHMGEYAAVKPQTGEDSSGKKKKKKKKEKKAKKLKFDADKDIDTAEHPNESPRYSPKKKQGDSEKDRAKKLKKKLLATLAPTSKKGSKA